MPKTIAETKEEIKEKLDKSIEEAEALQDVPVIEDEEQTEPEEQEEKAEEKVEEEPEVEPSPDYKKKFGESSREAQKKVAANRVINKALADAEELPEPTEEDLQKEFHDWDLMTDIEKTLAKETVVSRNWRQTIKSAKDQASKIEKWNSEVTEFIDDPKTFIDYPELEGKQDEFVDFANKDTHNSVPFETLVSSFLYNKSKDVRQNKGKMFERGSGGPNDKPIVKSDKLTLEEGRKLRERDWPKYLEMVKARKIDISL